MSRWPGSFALVLAALVLVASPAAAQAPVWVRSPHAPAPAEKVLAALQNRMSCEFVETPLADVVQFLADQVDVPILVDEASLDEAGIGSDAPLSFQAKHLPLEEILTLALGRIYAAWLPRGEALVVTSASEAEARLLTRVYPVGDLAGEGGEEGLIELITSVVSPESWDTAGGPAVLAAFSRRGVLVCTQSWANHAALEDLLQALREAPTAEAESGGGSAPDAPASAPPPADNEAPPAPDLAPGGEEALNDER